MFGIGPWELMLVFAIVLLLFGGKRLPGIASGLGSAIRNFKEASKEPLESIEEHSSHTGNNENAAQDLGNATPNLKNSSRT